MTKPHARAHDTRHAATAARADATPLGGSPLAPVPWLPILETGHAEIDHEHQGLIEDTNTILAIFTRQEPWPVLQAAARTMRDRCVAHFEHEDHLFKALRFPGADRHRRSHRRIMAEINGILATLETVDTPNRLDWELALSLRGILVDHLLREDLAYKSHLMHVDGRR